MSDPNPFSSRTGASADASAREEFDYIKCSDIEESEGEAEWLIKFIWSAESAGIIGGEPKSFKSGIGLEMAVAIASGKRFLGKFEVPNAGPVLIFLAEDRLPMVKKRLVGICDQRGLSLADLPLYTLKVPNLKIDKAKHQEKLRKIIDLLRPKFVLLDPLVRISTVDENNVAEVKPLFEFIDSLKTDFGLSVALVHHAKKEGRGGYGLRGSSDIYAWVENLLMTEKESSFGSRIKVHREFRYDRSPEPLRVQVIECDGGAFALELVDSSEVSESDRQRAASLQVRILNAVMSRGEPISFNDIKAQVGGSNDPIREYLKELVAEGVVSLEDGKYSHREPAFEDVLLTIDD